MAFTTNMTGTTQLDNNAVIAYDQAFILENEQGQVLDSNIVDVMEMIDAKSFNFPRYGALTPTSTPLTEDADVTSEAMADTEIVITPAEFGNVVTTTLLSNLQSGGRTNVGAAALAGKNAARSQDLRAMAIMDAGGTEVLPDGVAAEANLAATDVVDAAFLEKVYNQLARASVPFSADGLYVAVMHDDCISDIREDSAAGGGWTDINKYNNQMPVLRNEVGIYKGFRIVRQNDATLTADGGATTVDSYRSYFLGFNGLGKAISKPVGLTITGPFDKLGRFLNIGWHGAYEYAIVEPNAVRVGVTASSRGANT
jgi:N4-gp56 family major capsid protein